MAQDAKKALRQSTVELLYTTDLDHIAVTDVVKAAKVSRTTFYRYYASVYDVVEELEEELLSFMRDINRWAVIEPVTASSSRLTQSAMARITAIYEHKDVLRAIMGPHGDPLFRQKATDVMARYWMQRLGQRSTPERQREIELYTTFMAAGHYAVIEKWVAREDDDLSPEEMARFLNKVFYAPFGSGQNLWGV